MTGADSAAPATIKITRGSEGWTDRARRYKVVVDDNPVGSIRRGETFQIPVQPGDHWVRMTIDWAGSPTIQVRLAPGDVALFQCQASDDASRLTSLFRPGARIRLTRVP
jgi:hypothetical protein